MKISKSYGLVATMLMALTLSGCGGENLKELNIYKTPETGFDTTQEVKIVFYHTMNKDLQDVLDAYIADFNLIYPNIKVDHKAIGGYDDVKDQSTAAISSGKNDCDIAYCYPDHLATYNKARSVIALDELINNTQKVHSGADSDIFGFTAEQKADFIEAYWNEGYSLGDNHMYCLPLSKSSEVMFYNKTFFNENNLSVPTTWDEMWNVCEQIKDIEPTSIPLGYDSSSNWFITMCEQLESGYTSTDENNRFLFDNDANRKFVTDLTNEYLKGHFTTKAAYGAYTSGLFVEQGANVQKSYMSIGSSAGAGNQFPAIDDATGKAPFEVGIARIPQFNPSNGKVISQGPDVCLFDSGNDQKIMASWLFVKFLTTSVEFQAQFSMTSGYTPVIKSVNDNPVYAEWLADAGGNTQEELKALSTKTCVEQADWYFTSPAFVGSSEARDQVGFILDSVFAESKTIDEAFKYAVQMCNAVR